MKKASSKLAEGVRQVTQKKDVPATASHPVHEGEVEKARKAVSSFHGVACSSHSQLQPTTVWPD